MPESVHQGLSNTMKKSNQSLTNGPRDLAPFSLLRTQLTRRSLHEDIRGDEEDERFTREFGREEAAESSEDPRSRALKESEKEVDEFLEEYGRPSEGSRPAEIRGDDQPEPSLADRMDVADLDDVAEPSSEGAAPSAPPAKPASDKHPLDEKHAQGSCRRRSNQGERAEKGRCSA